MSEKHVVFIEVEVDDSVAGDLELARKLAEVCPVDIFEATASGVDGHAHECGPDVVD